ncbi:hypothetical protein C9I57_20665 [Trinickia symbiotica]|uniref:Uncharacterized protein n=1 Tax=Trinickia symbiotica TaxID=863227 RepID=A0A2T3XQZ4_9BURK|nr:hypothetical protein C9I57_20665 [Trinickia symbiotica]
MPAVGFAGGFAHAGMEAAAAMSALPITNIDFITTLHWDVLALGSPSQVLCAWGPLSEGLGQP